LSLIAEAQRYVLSKIRGAASLPDCLDMSPDFPAADIADGHAGYSIFSADLCEPAVSSGVPFADFNNLSRSKPGLVVPLTANKALGACARPISIPIGDSPAPDHIVDIVTYGPFSQVVRIAARRVVARVENSKANWIISGFQHVSKTVGLVCAHPATKASVPVNRTGPLPRPAFIWSALVHVRPKTGDLILPQLRKWSRIGFSHLISFQDRAVRAAEVFPHFVGSLHFTPLTYCGVTK
jgi:hypothetical protein